MGCFPSFPMLIWDAGSGLLLLLSLFLRGESAGLWSAWLFLNQRPEQLRWSKHPDTSLRSSPVDKWVLQWHRTGKVILGSNLTPRNSEFLFYWHSSASTHPTKLTHKLTPFTPDGCSVSGWWAFRCWRSGGIWKKASLRNGNNASNCCQPTLLAPGSGRGIASLWFA